MDLTRELNAEQLKGATHIEGPLLLLAGAGSGKTRVLTYRIAHMVSKGINPYNIIAITFTNKAAREMLERVERILQKNGQVWVSTFHSTCVRILRREIHHIDYDNNFTIYDADDSEKLIKQCIKELNYSDKEFPVKTVKNIISSQKNELVTVSEFRTNSESNYRLSKIANIYELYQKKLRTNNALDFDDLIFKTVELFYVCPDVLEKYQERFRYIMIDEYQDTNTAQYKLVRLLADKYKNICVVGDDNQSIYGWRGADIRNILEFEKDFEDTTVIKLEQNYRSTANILNAANEVITYNMNRKEKNLWTDKSEGEKIHFYRAYTDNEEGSFIADKVQTQVQAGHRYRDFAVLYRNNAQSRAIEEQLVRAGIPYRIFGGVRFYERMEIKDVLAYLKAIHNPFDNVAFIRIINVPRRGIGDTTVEKIQQYASVYEISFNDALVSADQLGLGARAKKIEEFYSMMQGFVDFSKKHTVSQLIEHILKETGYLKELEIENTDESRSRVDNVKELITKAIEFEKGSEVKDLQAFLEDVSLVADIDNYSEDSDTVVLMTLHSSKGLEFPKVFIAGFEDGLFPSYRSIMSPDKNDLEEERRLCYVGITRAKDELYLTAARTRMQNGEPMSNAISRFLNEIPAGVIDYMNDRPKERTNAKKIIGKTGFDTDFSAIKRNPAESLPKPKNVVLDYKVGDYITQVRYGVGLVTDIKPAGADYEVTVQFDSMTVKKFMSSLANLKKTDR